MKKIFLIITAVVSSMTVAADGFEYNYLAFTRSNGVDQTVSVGDLKIVFQEGQLVCTNADGTTSFPSATSQRCTSPTSPPASTR